MNQIWVIAAGGSIGALCRFWVANGIYAWLGRDFPHGTLVVNVSGCFLMGFLSELLLQRFPLPEYRAAILVGFLGAYTTFSSFSLETLYLFEQGGFLKAFLNVFLSVLFCLAAVWLGVLIGRKLLIGDGLAIPFAAIGASLGLALMLGLGFEFFFQKMDGAADAHEKGLIVLLGFTATLSALLLQMSGLKLASPWVWLNALGSAGAFWLGILFWRQ